MKCWICKTEEGKTQEHFLKASDLRGYYKEISPENPIYLHVDDNINQAVGSAKSKKLKTVAPICAYCNNVRTQPHDYAWERISKYLHKNWKSISKSKLVNLGKIFPGSSKSEALNVHLYFVKLFGCRIIEESIPIDVSSFSSSIMNGIAHEHVYLSISESPLKNIKYAQTSELTPMNGCSVSDASGWMYTFSPVSIFVGYLFDYSKYTVWQNSWHPNAHKKLLKLAPYKK